MQEYIFHMRASERRAFPFRKDFKLKLYISFRQKIKKMPKNGDVLIKRGKDKVSQKKKITAAVNTIDTHPPLQTNTFD